MDIDSSPKSINFSMFKLHFKRENHLISIPPVFRSVNLDVEITNSLLTNSDEIQGSEIRTLHFMPHKRSRRRIAY